MRKKEERKTGYFTFGAQYSDIKAKINEERTSLFQGKKRTRKHIYIIGSLLGTAMTVFIVCFSNPKKSQEISPSTTEEKKDSFENETVNDFYVGAIPETFDYLGNNYHMLFSETKVTKDRLLGYIVDNDSKIEGLKEKNPDIKCEFLVDPGFYDYYRNSIAPIYSLIGYDHYEYISIVTSFGDYLFYIS